ncbi:MAG TPA: M2 family metallopeptidase, partial [Planctomycetota bacterium]|nr:M2 family metallopeptidase [Planctomycetota bacterium]
MHPTRLGLVLLILSPSFLSGCVGLETAEERSIQARSEGESFLREYQTGFQELYAIASEAEWASNTRIVAGDDTNAERTRAANEALAAFTGSVDHIETARRLLGFREDLEPLQVRCLERVLYLAADAPQSVPELVVARIAAEAAQNERLYGFTYTLDGAEVTTNELDRALREETDLARRRAVWEASKQVGPTLRDGLVELRDLRNQVVRALGYPDYFSYQTSEYDMDAAEMLALTQRINRELRPLFRELHTWARYTLAERYGEAVPDLIPADWLPNRWGQDWTALVDVEGFDLDGALAARSPEWLVQQAERFYTSLGFEALPPVFWERS